MFRIQFRLLLVIIWYQIKIHNIVCFVTINPLDYLQWDMWMKVIMFNRKYLILIHNLGMTFNNVRS